MHLSTNEFVNYVVEASSVRVAELPGTKTPGSLQSPLTRLGRGEWQCRACSVVSLLVVSATVHAGRLVPSWCQSASVGVFCPVGDHGKSSVHQTVAKSTGSRGAGDARVSLRPRSSCACVRPGTRIEELVWSQGSLFTARVSFEGACRESGRRHLLRHSAYLELCRAERREGRRAADPARRTQSLRLLGRHQAKNWRRNVPSVTRESGSTGSALAR